MIVRLIARYWLIATRTRSAHSLFNRNFSCWFICCCCLRGLISFFAFLRTRHVIWLFLALLSDRRACSPNSPFLLSLLCRYSILEYANLPIPVTHLGQSSCRHLTASFLTTRRSSISDGCLQDSVPSSRSQQLLPVQLLRRYRRGI